MPSATPTSVGPFAVTMDVEFIDRLGDPVRAGRAKSVSEIIRTALERYDFTDVMFLKPAQVMISVRLPAAVRQNLKKLARAKRTSVGQLVRAAVEAYLPQLEADAGPPAAPPPAVGPAVPPAVVLAPPPPAVVPAVVPVPPAPPAKTRARKSLAKPRSVPKNQRRRKPGKKSPARKNRR
ncbi:MAG: ribbon-helix-helix protein, CopG family [Opitutae bacterium]|nr:ribbon-helix-helix protein, CopG family [Opitutae bacterium]